MPQSIVGKQEIVSQVLPKSEGDDPMKLNQKTIERLPLPEDKDRDDVIYFDESLSGFGLRIRGGTRRTWIAQYRVGHQQRRSSIASVEKVGPDEARKAAKKLLAKATLGGDP